MIKAAINFNLNSANTRSYLSISCVSSPLEDFDTAKCSDLSEQEKTVLNEITHKKKRHEFLIGRIAAKCAIKKVVKDLHFPDVTIGSGVFGQPLQIGGSENIFNISLAHTDSIAASLLLPQGYPCGIDIEFLKSENENDFIAICSEREIKLFRSFYNEDIAPVSAKIWVLKESISKALNCGFTIPIQLYEIDMIKKSAGGARITFRYFSQYQGLVINFDKFYLGLVIPKQVDIPQNIECDIRHLFMTSISEFH